MADANSTLKMCRKCGTHQLPSQFPSNRKCVDGRSSYCRECHRGYSNRWRNRNRDYDLGRKKDQRRRGIGLSTETPDNRNKRRKSRYRSDPNVRLRECVSAAVRAQLRGGKGGSPVFAILGYTLEDLAVHLERQFHGGMGWENYGDWHVDHIVPLSSFTITSKDDPEIRRAWCLTNLRPLWAKDNLSKGSKRTHLL